MKRYLLFLVLLVLTACGGQTSSPQSSSVSSVSGVAAAGAPIIGWAYLKDSAGVTLGPTEIGANGRFSFDDVSGLTPPFVLQAEGAAGGMGYTLIAIASGVGNNNINPVTNLVAAKAVGGDPRRAFQDPSVINQAILAQAISDIQRTLKPLLDLYRTTVEAMSSGEYNADPATNSADAMLENFKIEVSSSGNVIIENKVTGDSLLNGSVANNNSLDQSKVPQTTIETDITSISELLKNWAVTIFSKAGSLSSSDIETLYVGSIAAPTPFGLHNGLSRSQHIQSLVTSINGGKMSEIGAVSGISNLSLRKDVTTKFSGMYKVFEIYATFNFQSGNAGAPDNGVMYVAKETVNSNWKLIGNQRKAEIYFNSTALKYKSPNSSFNAAYYTGLDIEIDDTGNQNVNSARVVGPGLPVAGLTFKKASLGVTMLMHEVQSRSMPWNSWDGYILNDSEINAIIQAGNSPLYTVYLYSTAAAGDTVTYLQKIEIKLNAPPILNSALTDAYFPSAAIQPTVSLTSLAQFRSVFEGKSVSFTYTKSTLYPTVWMNVSSHEEGSNGWNNFDKSLNISKTASTIIMPTPQAFTPTYANVRVGATDSAHRTFNNVVAFW